MESVWYKPELADEILNNHGIFDQTQSIITDIMSNRITLIRIIENMRGVLTSTLAEHREKGMQFFTKILKEIPKDFFDVDELKFISNYYVERMKDVHRLLPAVLEGYLMIVNMKNYKIDLCDAFFRVLFSDVGCQMQVRQDRYHIYLITQKLLDRDVDYMKTLGLNFPYGIIQAIDGERDPRNLMFLFSFLPRFIQQIPLGNLIEDMFAVISCYFPIDFHPSPDDPAAVTRQELATALTPCLCALPEFAEQCLLLLVEKLDSSLRLAKIDSLKLLTQSCNTFKAESYSPFIKALWSSIHREISHKTDDELKMAAHEALSALVKKMSTTVNTDRTYENFIKGILISMQTAIAESMTVAQFVQATRVLLTTANASKESCIIITTSMIPASIAFYGFKTSSKLQIASLDFLGDLYDLAKHWEVLDIIQSQVKEIPHHCLTAVSKPKKEYQIAGFRTLIRVKNALESDLVLPLTEILIHNIQHSQDNDLLSISVETVHAIARKYPELIMSLVVKGKCDLDNLTQDEVALQKRLNLLSNLASIDDFTKIIIEEMLKLIKKSDKEASKVVEALSDSMSDSSLYSDEKVQQIESDHGLVDSVLTWVLKEIKTETLTHACTLISNTVGSLPAEKQLKVLAKHTDNMLGLSKADHMYFLVLESLYNSLQKSVYEDRFQEIMSLSLILALNCDNDSVKTKACALTAHFLNKAECGPKFDILYEQLTSYLSSCNREDNSLCPRIILLYGWITKALIMRGSDLFSFWLQKITVVLTNKDYCTQGAEAIGLIMTDSPDYLTPRHHCRVSPLYKQRMFQSFSGLTEKLGDIPPETRESYLLSWAYVLAKTPKSVLNNEVNKIAPLVIDSLEYDNKDLLLVMLDVLCYFIQSENSVADSLQTILPRLISLSKYVKSMDVRIKSLECLHDIANTYRTIILLPFKQDILLDLAPSLDDRKRLVRSMAVKARTRWFVIGAPGEGKTNN